MLDNCFKAKAPLYVGSNNTYVACNFNFTNILLLINTA